MSSCRHTHQDKTFNTPKRPNGLLLNPLRAKLKICSSYLLYWPKHKASHERANLSRGRGAKPRALTFGSCISRPSVEEAELPNGEQPRTGKPAVTRGRKADGPRLPGWYRATCGARRLVLGGRATERRSLTMLTTILKGVLMRCMWLTENVMVMDEATVMAQFRAFSLRCSRQRIG